MTWIKLFVAKLFKNRIENRCRQAGRAYFRANGACAILLIILLRYCPLIRSERIDILSVAAASVG